ncbi:Zinc finger C2H2-type [Trinorchestia longiramus]|nr:Zinc finger C2H2-type [Trinorchestia longiramus]
MDALSWSPIVKEEKSIVAEILDSFDGVDDQIIELSICDEQDSTLWESAPTTFIKQENCGLVSFDDSNGSIEHNSNFNLSDGAMPSSLRNRKARTLKRTNEITSHVGSAISSGQDCYKKRRKKSVNDVKKFKKEKFNFYPLTITSSKVHVKHYDVKTEAEDSCLLDEMITLLEEDGKECGTRFFERCDVTDQTDQPTLQIEYGSGVDIYESVEAWESDSEVKDHQPSTHRKVTAVKTRCNRCAVQFSSRSELLQHRKHVHRNQFSCDTCGAVYKNAFKYHCHMASHDSRFTCDQCKRTFQRITGFKKHMRYCHKVANPNICVVCGLCLASFNELDLHIKGQHPDDYRQVQSFFKQCSHCRYQFMTELTYLNHIKSAPYSCPECNLLFECNNKLNSHMSFKHKPQVCDHCGKEFEAFDQYTYHVRYHHTDKHIKCPYCDERFRVRSRLLIHIDVNHTEGHNYKCNHCDYTAKNYASVNRHRRIAHMPKSETHKNVCSICGKSFLVLSRLKVHMKSHSDDKPFVCTVCGRGYKFQYLLKRHLRNPELCLRVLFPNGTRLERKGKRRCDMCYIDFPSPDELAIHMVQVHKVKIETKEVRDDELMVNEPPENILPQQEIVVQLKHNTQTPGVRDGNLEAELHDQALDGSIDTQHIADEVTGRNVTSGANAVHLVNEVISSTRPNVQHESLVGGFSLNRQSEKSYPPLRHDVEVAGASRELQLHISEEDDSNLLTASQDVPNNNSDNMQGSSGSELAGQSRQRYPSKQKQTYRKKSYYRPS